MRHVFAARTSVVAVLGAGLIVALAGSYALASGSATITACVHKHGGALYVAKKCARHDHKLNWNTAGSPGPSGAPGPTYGTVSTGDDPPSLTSASVVDTSLTVDLPAAGTVWVQAHFDPNVSCTPSPEACKVFYGIYVDGTPVNGGERIFEGGAASPVESWGISTPVAAGKHQITLEYTPSGDLLTLTEQVKTELGAILLGGS